MFRPQSTRCQEGTKEKGEKQKVQVQSHKVTEIAVTRDGLTPAHARIPAAPCTIANRFCSVGLEWADMQRSIHLVVRYVASLKRSASVMVAGTTSSSAMMMSAPGKQMWANWTKCGRETLLKERRKPHHNCCVIALSQHSHSTLTAMHPHALVAHPAIGPGKPTQVWKLTFSSTWVQPDSPRRFCICIDCSGVSSMRLPSTGDWKVTPSSVISARCSRETI